jgi:hypothetical protein
VTDDILCTGKVPDINALIAQCAFLPADAYVLLEELPQRVSGDREDRQDLLRFARYGANIEKNKIGAATSGRIFNQKFELRWERNAGTTSVVYLGEPREVAGLTKDDTTLPELDKVDEAKRYYLFGEYLDEGKLGRMGIEMRPGETYYAEVRIPRLLRYPITEQSRRVQLTVCEYREKATGQVKLFRFQGLEPAKE